MKEVNPKVFISYSHDSKEHQNRVLNFSNKLRDQGIDSALDQYEDSPPEGWPKWMDRNIDNSDFILIVCTETYYKRVKGDDSEGKGIKWESTLIYQQLYNAGANNTRFIPVIFSDGKFEHIPEPMQGATFYNVDDTDAYEKLYWRLRGEKAAKPELGKLRKLEIKERKTLFVSSLIDIELWEKANWKGGMGYLTSVNDDLPPVMILVFEDKDFGRIIFKQLIELVGNEDKSERIRISIVEGEVPNQESGYFVIFGENPNATSQLVSSLDESETMGYFITQQRIHRVFVKSEAKNLATFKTAFKKHGCYYITLGQEPECNNAIKHEADLMIFKRDISFRMYDQIPEADDIDSVIKSDEAMKHKY